MHNTYTIAFTGHRPDKLGGYGPVNPKRDALKERLTARLSFWRNLKPELCCISGMAVGFDQWAVEVCLLLEIPLIAAVPFKGQESHWPDDSQRRYQTLITQAMEVIIVCDGAYAPWKMQKRNEWMIDHCDLLIGAWDGSPGGTANCIRYARRSNRPFENLLEP